MGLFDKLESKLEQGVNGAFARAFKAEVQPVEIASGMRRAMDDRASSVKKGQRPVVPNLFTIELSPTDYERLSEWGTELDDELIASAQEHCDEQRYLPGGPITIVLAEEHDLETGVFRLRPATAKAADALAHSRKHPRPQPPVASNAPAEVHEPKPAKSRINTATGAGASTAAGATAATGTSAPHANPQRDAAVNGSLGSRIKSYLLGETEPAATASPQRESHEEYLEHSSDSSHEDDYYDNDPRHHDDPRAELRTVADEEPHSDDVYEDDSDAYDDYAGTSAAQARTQQQPSTRQHHGERGDAVPMPARKPKPKAAAPAPAPETTRPKPQAQAPEAGRPKAVRPAPQPRNQPVDRFDEHDESESTARFTPPPAAPAPAQRARTTSPRQRPWLKIDGQRYPLLGAITTLGRDDDADIVIDDPGVSRRHSEIRITHDGPHLVMSVRDLGSTNGTFVNGDRIESQHLRDGDRLTIGRTHMTIHPGDRA